MSIAKKQRKGFTLVELIIVLVILAILIAILIPAYTGYVDKSKGTSSIANARQAYTASKSGLLLWKSAGSPGRSDRDFKINIETEIIKLLELGEMSSYMKTLSKENSVQVALSLPSSYYQGWERFLDECESNNMKNFVRVWIGKNPDKTIGDFVNAVYYVSADGKYAARIVYDGTTKLGAPDQRTGVYFERIGD